MKKTTKKELNSRTGASGEALSKEISILRALRWSEALSIAPDVPIPDSSSSGTAAYAYGWLFDVSKEEIAHKWTSRLMHGDMRPDGTRSTMNNMRSGMSLYSTPERALRALRCEMERNMAERLAAIDRKILELE